MIDALIYGLAIVGALTILRAFWKVGKLTVAAWRLRRAVLRVQRIRRSHFDEAVRRGLVNDDDISQTTEQSEAN